MSSGSSPSLLTYLRQYRFQRKPNSPSPSSSLAVAAPTTSSSAVVRPVSSSVPAPQPYVYKRIQFQDSDSDEASPPAKRPAPAPALELTAAVKERRYRNMSEMFPDLVPTMIKTVLYKHNWNEERARDELLKFDPESDIPTPVAGGSRTAHGAGAGPHARPTYVNGVRVAPGVTVVRTQVSSGRPLQLQQGQQLAGKGGHRRKGSDSDDSDYGVRKGRDDKVYDSDDSDTEVTNHMSGDKRKVFEFINTCKPSELTQLSGCSQKKADVLVSIRPFATWIEMVEKLQGSKHLSTDILNSAQELLSTRNNIQRLMKKCVGLANQLEVAVAAGAGLLQQPSILDSSLKLAPYQVVGLNWLAVLHKQGVNGILADEMGLGKTVQVIAFLAHLKQSKQASGTHLVVVPASTLDNWSNEFARWCPSMRISMYYGAPDERRSLRVNYARGGLADIDVILTTYTMVNSCPEERKMFRVTPLHYVVYDEAHMLKNMSTQRYDNLVRIKSKHRLLLTGTPLQNNLLELMSLLCFVMPHMFSGKADDLKSLFQKNSKGNKKTTANGGGGDGGEGEEEVPLFEQSQIQQAKRIMKPFLLRRLKRDVLSDLPKKTDYTELCSMSPRQQTLYKDMITYFSSKDGTIHSSNEQSGMSMMMDMRKLANHPLLMRHHYTEERLRPLARRLALDPTYKENKEQYVLDDLLCLSDFQIHKLTQQHQCISTMKVPTELIVDSGKFMKLDEMLPRLKSEGHRVLIFSQFTMMLDILEPYLQLRGYRYLRLDGQTAVVERQELIDRYNAEDIFVFLLSTRAGGLGINLTAADTVIIHDIDFNPYNDKQAEDRCHRMGQTRPVSIYRLLSAGTIEEGIHQVAKEKLNLERDITKTDENEPAEQKSVQRLLSVALGLTTSAAAGPAAPAK